MNTQNHINTIFDIHTEEKGRESTEFKYWNDAEWDNFLSFLEMNGLSALFYSKVEKYKSIPSEILSTLKEKYEENKVRNNYNFTLAGEFSSMLNSIDIENIVLKGVCLGELIYENPAIRGYSDIDFLIRKDDLGRLIEKSSDISLQIPRDNNLAWYLNNHYEIPTRFKGNDISLIDIHWNIAQKGRHWIKTNKMWERKVEMSEKGVKFYRLNNEDLFLHLAIHLSYHYFAPFLQRIYDIYTLTETLNLKWDTIVQRAKKWKVENIVYLTAKYVDQIFRTDLCSKIPDLIPDSLRKMLFHFLFSNKKHTLFKYPHSSIIRNILGVLTIDRIRDQISFSFQKLWRNLRYGSDPWPCELL